MIHARLQLDHGAFSLDLNVQLPGRGVTALYGPSGSGKTTCLRCIAGLERPARGFIEVNGQVWQDSEHAVFVPPHKRSVGYVFQEASLFAH
ncbi:ATP-binding cassette domain-containing protein, partial [Pseudomonas brassicacearum]|uniref:ATP-binding cassette domain-containing protein n=2 Tax=Pseudomonas TaxID=286 RepID=UPI000F4798B7